MAENRQLAKPRPSDSQFPILMTRTSLKDYLGRSDEIIDKLLKYTRLSESVFQLDGTDPMYNKAIVDEVIPTLGKGVY